MAHRLDLQELLRRQVPAIAGSDVRSTPEKVTEGAYTDAQAPGALPNGTRIRKCIWEAGDPHPLHAPATVRGSIGPVRMQGRKRYMYFVEWDGTPGAVIGIRDDRIEPLPATAGPAREGA